MNENIPSSEEQHQKIQNAAAQLKSGASWFYLIGGLSIVNSLVFVFGADLFFVIGLGFNYVVTAVVLAAGNTTEAGQIDIVLKLIIFVLNAAAAGVFLVFGYFANKKYAWAFITGAILYALDGLIFLAVGDYLSLIFHGIALFFIFKGYKASIDLKKMETEAKFTESGLAQPIK
ncbi:MAG: hypothetical protein JXA06_04260 [Bacteroidetes bacterium]|nr:hypothetical protein [Bacteroidota bacterium]